MFIKINTKGNWEGDIGDEDNALEAMAIDNTTVKELEKTLIEINRFLIMRIEEIENS